MISDDERREVAARLLVYSHDFDFDDSDPFLYVAKAAFGDVDVHTYYSVFARLADLIDRPTCHVTSMPGNDENDVCESCSVCDFGWHKSRFDPPYRYCPNCGAEVVMTSD